MKWRTTYNIDADDCIFSCENLIENKMEEICTKFDIPKDEIARYFSDLIVDIKYEIENIEAEEVLLEDFDEEDMEEFLSERGYFIMKTNSLKIDEKVQAFLEKLKNDPYGPMIIL